MVREVREGDGENDGQAKRLKEPQTYTAIAKQPEPTAQDIVAAPPKQEKKNNEPKDVLDEYLSTATPGEGTITFDDGYDKGKFKDEVATAQWLHDNLGGDIHVLRDVNQNKIKTPDYLWRGKFWELKSVTTEKAADTAVRKALKQISGNPGGVILNYSGNNISLDEAARIISDRVGRGCDFDVDVMIIQNQEATRILRYKK